MKKLMSFIVITILLFVGTSNICEAQAKPKLNKSIATLETESTLQLTIENSKKEVSWSSIDKSIASVNKSGKVTAVKVGSTTITAAIGKEKYCCIVIVVDSAEAISDKDIQSKLDFGKYIVGYDIDPGSYKVIAIDGSGTISKINKTEGKAIFISKNGSGLYAAHEIDSIEFEYGDIITISDGLILEFISIE